MQMKHWVLLLAVLLCSGCSIKKMAINSMADSLAKSSDVYASDDDPELIRQALPFALKTIESLLVQAPKHEGLLVSAASGFTQYSYAFVQCEADYIENTDLAQATAMRLRAGKLYRRAMDYGFQGLEVEHPGFRTDLQKDTSSALAKMQKKDVPLLYWTAVGWGARISLAKEDSELTADLSLMEAMMRRALELDESFDAGAIHDFFLAYEGGKSASAGISLEQLQRHFDQAMRLSEGKRVTPLVIYAEVILVANQKRAEFEKMLNQALAFNSDSAPDQRLPNLVAQKRARWLLSQIDTLFIE